MKKPLLVLPVFLLLFSNAHSQAITIAAARALGPGATVTVRGIIINGDELGTIRYIQDPTAGLGLYSSTLSNVQRGDSIEVTGMLDDYNNLLEMNPVSNYTLISSGNDLPEPFEVNMATGFTEPYEGMLVRFNNSTFISTGYFQTASANYDATDGSVTSEEVRINSTSNIAGAPIPTAAIDLIGIMSQYQSTYQLLPRDLDDFVTQGNPPVITTAIGQINIAPGSFDITFSSLNAGNTVIYYGTTTSLGSEVSNPAMVTEHAITVSGLNPATLYYVKAATVSASGDTSFAVTTPMMTQSLSSGTIKSYFTRTVDNSVAQGVNAVSLGQVMDDTLIAYMNRAVYTMDIAIYNMDNNNGIVDAINAAYNRGVVVRVIGDGGNMDGSAFAQLNIGLSNKKLSPTGVDYGIMHNKFMIIDANAADPMKSILWTGSMNFTAQQVNVDANNVIIFQDQTLAKAYQMEFDEMWSGVFSQFKTNNTPKEFNVGGNRVELYFSPSDDTESEIKRVAETADHDLELCVFAYTRFNISYVIDDQVSAGAWGGGIIDDTSNGSYSYSILASDMINTLFVANHSYLVHHKYLLVDANAPAMDPTVLTGSHNWSTSAQFDNDENTVVVHNASVANQYFQEWVARYHDEGGTQLPGYISGIYESSQAASLTVFPNPASNWLQLKYDLRNSQDALLKIMDMSGRVMLQQTVDRSAANSDHVDISSLQSGTYLLQLSREGLVATGKLIVAR